MEWLRKWHHRDLQEKGHLRKDQELKMGDVVNLTLSANHPVHPCAPDKGSAHTYTQNCARIHRESLEDAHARAQ